MATISIHGMEFFAYHGCFKEEQIIGTRFMVDIHLETDTRLAEYSDDLKQTINYQSVYLLTREEMAKKSKLLEHVARRIVDRIFRDFSTVERVFINMAKMNPPVGGKVGSVSISFTETREDNRNRIQAP